MSVQETNEIRELTDEEMEIAMGGFFGRYIPEATHQRGIFYGVEGCGCIYDLPQSPPGQKYPG
jgi:hypothetical protein